MSFTMLSRRKFFGAATAAAASQAGLSILASSRLARSGSIANGLIQSLRFGEGTALAQSASGLTACSVPVAIVNLSAKSDANTQIYVPDATGVGIVGNSDYAPYTSSGPLGSMSLANWFGSYLAPIEQDISVAQLFVDKGNGNHDWNTYISLLSSTGCPSCFLNKAAGALLSLDFGVQATADTSTAVFGEGGTQSVSYSSIDSAVAAITGAVTPLQALPKTSGTLLTSLNNLISSDRKFAAQLAELGEVLQGTVAPLKAAQAAADAKPMALATTDYLNAAAVTANNPLLHQLAIAAPLWDAGLTKAVTFTLGSNDVNGGGDFVGKTGGGNTTGGGLSATMAKAMLGNFIAAFFAKYPQGVVCWIGEGGRDDNGGDNPKACAGIATAANLMPTQWIGVGGKNPPASAAAFAGNVPAVKLSDGTTMAPNDANFMATVAALSGVAYGNYATLADIPLPKAG
jgi:hypothetical protein